VVARDDPPHAELLGELERMPADAAGQGPGRTRRVAVERDVVVGGLASEQPVADRAADKPRGPVEVGQRVQRIGHSTLRAPSRR
jgi:hypothetical protein